MGVMWTVVVGDADAALIDFKEMMKGPVGGEGGEQSSDDDGG